MLDTAGDLDHLTANTGAESPVTVRWFLSHLLEETARHARHADILRELVDATAVRWSTALHAGICSRCPWTQLPTAAPT